MLLAIALLIVYNNAISVVLLTVVKTAMVHLLHELRIAAQSLHDLLHVRCLHHVHHELRVLHHLLHQILCTRLTKHTAYATWGAAGWWSSCSAHTHDQQCKALQLYTY